AGNGVGPASWVSGVSDCAVVSDSASSRSSTNTYTAAPTRAITATTDPMTASSRFRRALASRRASCSSSLRFAASRRSALVVGTPGVLLVCSLGRQRVCQARPIPALATLEPSPMGHWSTCWSPVSRRGCGSATATSWRRGADAIVIDPGQRAMGPLRRILDENRLTPAAVLLTHGHVDHIWSAQKVADTYGCPAYIHPEDRFMLTDPIKGFGPRIGQLLFGALFAEPRQVIELAVDGEQLNFGELLVTADHTPGHTRGSVVFRVAGDSTEVAFTGDTLFKQSVGRTDLPGGSGRDLLTSIVNKLMVLDDDTLV